MHGLGQYPKRLPFGIAQVNGIWFSSHNPLVYNINLALSTFQTRSNYAVDSIANTDEQTAVALSIVQVIFSHWEYINNIPLVLQEKSLY